jgi:hypothetical protein
MKRSSLSDLSIENLVQQFAEIGVAQYKALDADDMPKYNRLFRKLMDIEGELKSRPGDQRTAVVALYGYPNMQVRLNAAKATLAVAPESARQVVETIAASTWAPQCYDARMCLWMIDEGKLIPT